jgi:hypothetical protein
MRAEGHGANEDASVIARRILELYRELDRRLMRRGGETREPARSPARLPQCHQRGREGAPDRQCPQPAEAENAGVEGGSGFDPKSGGPKCCDAQHDFSTMW